MPEEGRQIAWRASKRSAPVYSSDGAQSGKVTHVVADDLKDIFSGIAFTCGMLGDEVSRPLSSSKRSRPRAFTWSVTRKQSELALRSVTSSCEMYVLLHPSAEGTSRALRVDPL